MRKSIDELYPNSEELKEFDLEDEVNEMVNKKIEWFKQAKKKAINQSALIESELENIEDVKKHLSHVLLFNVDNLPYPGTLIQPGFDDLNLMPFLNIGWDKAIYGDFIVTNDAYKRYYFFLDQLNDILYDERYDSTSPEFDPFCEDNSFNKEPPHIGFFAYYFENLSDEVIFFMQQGMASAKYYYWLKDQENGKDKSISNISSKFSSEQLLFIFTEMVKLGNIEKSQKQVFLDTFQGNKEMKLLKWTGKQSLVRYFFQQITGLDDIKPSEINKYIVDPIYSNDNYTGRSHLPIKKIFTEVVNIK